MATVVGLILLGGILGGLGNLCLPDSTPPPQKSDAAAKATVSSDWRRRVLSSLLLGIVAALLVPLFLSMASSSLVSNAAADRGQDQLVLLGFCLVAALFSRRFIETVSERAFALAQEARREAAKAEEKVNDLEGHFSEPEHDPTKSLSAFSASTEPPTKELLILRVLKDDKRWIFRTEQGIAGDAHLSIEEVATELTALEQKGLVERRETGPQARTLWTITRAGRESLDRNSQPV